MTSQPVVIAHISDLHFGGHADLLEYDIDYFAM